MRLQRAGLRLVALSVLALSLGGCVYMHVQRPLDENFQETRLGDKVGKSHAYSILWLVAWGDAGTKTAAENGGISIIRHADTENLLWLGGVYARLTTVVYGD